MGVSVCVVSALIGAERRPGALRSSDMGLAGIHWGGSGGRRRELFLAPGATDLASRACDPASPPPALSLLDGVDWKRCSHERALFSELERRRNCWRQLHPSSPHPRAAVLLLLRGQRVRIEWRQLRGGPGSSDSRDCPVANRVLRSEVER